LLGFFTIAHGWTWLMWSVALLLGRDVRSFPSIVLVALGRLGPPLAGIVMTRVSYGRGGLRDLWRRVVDLTRIRSDPLEFLFAIVMTTALITWIYNNTRRSVLAATLFHFVNNLTGEIVRTSGAVAWYRAGLAAGVVLMVIAMTERSNPGAHLTAASRPGC